MKTLVKIERYKLSGKFLEVLEYESRHDCFQTNLIKLDAIQRYSFLAEEAFTIEVKSLNSSAWNKYLCISHLFDK